MTQQQMNELVGEITAINEEISEFSAQGDNVQPLIAERNSLVRVLEWALYKTNAAPGATGTADVSN